MTSELIQQAQKLYGTVAWRQGYWWWVEGEKHRWLSLVANTGKTIPLFFNDEAVAVTMARELNGDYNVTSYWPGNHVLGDHLAQDGRHLLNWDEIVIPYVDYEIKFFPNLIDRKPGYTLADYVFTGRCPVCKRRHRLAHGLGGFYREHHFTNWPNETRWVLDCCTLQHIPRWQMGDLINTERQRIEAQYGKNQPRKKSLKW